MKFFTAAAFLFSAAAASSPFAPKQSGNDAKQAYHSKLLRAAKPTENSQLHRGLAEEQVVDISNYAVKFEQCQFVKAYDQEQAADEENSTVLATKRFVLFRLCPNSACGSCNYNYGEYLIDLESYLEATVEYYQNYQEGSCQACNEMCYNQNQNQDGQRKLENQKFYNVDCDSCVTECEKIQNMENNGFVDATNFLECQLIYDPDDDSVAGLYAGPICASQGTRINIGVFKDDQCLFADNSKVVDDYVQKDGVALKLSHNLLKKTYTDTCISCKEPREQQYNEYADQQDADEVIELCENLYNEAAKCEKAHGFTNGYAGYYGYENQLAQEEVVCEFMQSLKSGTYDEEGEIIVKGASSAIGGPSATGVQKFALTFFTLGTVGLAVYAAMLHSKLMRGSGINGTMA